MSTEELPIAEFAYPGPLRDALVGAILSGEKTTTTSLYEQYLAGAEPLPQAGERYALIDSQEQAVAVIEVTQVRLCPLGEVPLEHAIAEGEGFTTLAQWRESHEWFWRSAEVTASLGGKAQLDDDSIVVLETLRLMNRIGSP